MRRRKISRILISLPLFPSLSNERPALRDRTSGCPHEAKVDPRNDEEEEDDRGDGNWRIKNEEHGERRCRSYPILMTVNPRRTPQSDPYFRQRFIIDGLNGARALFALILIVRILSNVAPNNKRILRVVRKRNVPASVSLRTFVANA